MATLSNSEEAVEHTMSANEEIVARARDGRVQGTGGNVSKSFHLHVYYRIDSMK